MAAAEEAGWAGAHAEVVGAVEGPVGGGERQWGVGSATGLPAWEEHPYAGHSVALLGRTGRLLSGRVWQFRIFFNIG